MFCDAHCDTLYEILTQNKKIEDNNLHIDCNRAIEVGLKNQIFAIWSNPNQSNHFSKAINAIKYFKSVENKWIYMVKSKDDLVKENLGGIMSVEGGEAFEGSIENLHKLYNEGLRCATLTWNGSNDVADGCMENNQNGLTNFGKDVVKNMENLGIIVDLSHICESAFWQVAKIAKRPFIASHSNCYSLCKHPRNLKDEQISEIIDRKGFVGINLYTDFLGLKGDFSSIIKHMEHILNLGGEDILGFGCDLDGVDKLPVGFTDILSMKNLIITIENQFGEDIANKIKYKNFNRIVGDIIG